MPAAGLPVDELAAAAPHAVHLLLQSGPVPGEDGEGDELPILEVVTLGPGEDVCVGVHEPGHPADLLEVGVGPVEQLSIEERLGDLTAQ